MYEDIIINCMRCLDMTDLTAIEEMTYYEFDIRMKAYTLQREDRERDMHVMAWLYREIMATQTVQGKSEYVYKSFASFFKPNNKPRNNDTNDARKAREEQLKAIAKRQEEWREKHGEL